MIKNDKIFCMGASFDERSDDDETSFEISVPVITRHNSSKNLAVESIPLVSK
jgi:hypothetical protein